MFSHDSMDDDSIVLMDQKTLAEYLRTLRYRKTTILLTFLAVVLGGALFVLLSKPSYTRTVRILVEGKDRLADRENPNDPLTNIFVPGYEHEVDTQLEVLKSDAILQAACDTAGVPRELVLDPIHPAIKIDVKQIAATDVIEVAVAGINPRQVDALSDALPRVYLNFVIDNRKKEVTNALDFAKPRKQEENSTLRAAEVRLERFKKQNKIANLDTERNERIIASLNAESKAMELQQAVDMAHARLAAALSARKSLPSDIQTVSSTTNVQAIEGQKQRIETLRSERADLLFFYRPGSPEVTRLDKQIAEAEGALAQTPPTLTVVNRSSNAAISAYDDRIVAARSDLRVARADLQTARVNVADLDAKVKKYSPLERQQAELVRDVEEHRDTYAKLGSSVDALELREKATHDPVMQLSGDTKALPVRTNLALLLMVCSLGGLVLGCGLALFQDSLDDRVHTVRDYQRVARTQILAYLPASKPKKALLLNKDCDGALLEGCRMLRANIQFAESQEPVKTLVVTSTLPGEGKSLTSLNLATLMAFGGRSAILVDADVRCPSLHTMLGTKRDPGLTSVLAGATTLDEAIQDLDVPGLRFLPAGPPTPMAAELLASGAMADLMKRLREMADIVIFDTPACQAAVDPTLLAALADGVVYVVQLGRVSAPALGDGMEWFRHANARVLGVAFNKVERSQSKEYTQYQYRRHYNRDTCLIPGAKPDGSAGTSTAEKN